MRPHSWEALPYPAVVLLSTAATLALSDCERIHDGLLAQPVNALTSLAYVAAGAWVMQRGRRRGRDARRSYHWFGGTLVAVGLGSIAFHGPGGATGNWLHDASIAVVPLLVLADLGAVRGRQLALGVSGVGGVVALAPAAGPAVAGSLSLAALVRQRWRPTGLLRTGLQRRAAAVGGASLLGGAALNALGRTGGPWCNANSAWQPHGAWHVLTAVAIAALAVVCERDAVPEYTGPVVRPSASAATSVTPR